MPRKVLVADENDSARRRVAQFLQEHGYQVYEAENGEAALDMIDTMTFDAAVVNYYMHGAFNGLDLLARQSRASPESKKVLITAIVNAHVKQMASSIGASCLPRSFNLNDLLRDLETVLPPSPTRKRKPLKRASGHS